MNKTYNYQLPQPYPRERTVRPRDKGMTMVMDKGLSLREAEDFLIDDWRVRRRIIKLGFRDIYRVSEPEREN